jgi:hypothetical protein
MDDALAGKLEALLNSPDAMEKIQGMMASLGGASEPKEAPSPSQPPGDLSGILQLMPLLSTLGQEDDNTTLLKAVRPYLHGGRERRLDDSVRMMQLVKLLRDGQEVRMSKRSGRAIQLADLLDEVSVDAARFLFNTIESNSQMNFDLDLAIQQDAQNPVYYVQYANARICSIARSLEQEGITPRGCTAEELMLLKTPEERELIRHLAAEAISNLI